MKYTYSFRRFNRLDNREKFQLVEHYGSCLDVSYQKGIYQILLYELFGFYVEAWFNLQDETLQKMTAFTDYKKLDPFLPYIELSVINVLL